ncbi:hypothetical protein [Hymenobacter amundsenii]|uniref:hypothetical protein n=1 Tax=Hymenobacter amundsenii TaxID=2006685 RepID=UPI000F82DB2A|nr:hypothetical protein [Hymenobacter amundsenii]
MSFKNLAYAVAFMLSSCSTYHEQFRSFYPIKACSKGLTEEGIISLYRDSTFQTNFQILQPLVARDAERRGGKVIGDLKFISDGYFFDYRSNKVFILYHPGTSIFYGFDLCNCGYPISPSQGLIGQNCDLRIASISVLQSDSVVKLGWADAGPALIEFKKSILPLIRRRVTSIKP